MQRYNTVLILLAVFTLLSLSPAYAIEPIPAESDSAAFCPSEAATAV